jgi:hypothetical protein
MRAHSPVNDVHGLRSLPSSSSCRHARHLRHYRSHVTQASFSDPPGVGAHRRLVDAAIAQHLDLPMSTGDYPHGGLHVLWRDAERAQRSILGGWEIEARDAVERLVQHILRLASSAEWFLTNMELRKLAVEETIVHNAYGWTVASEDAQQAWHALWVEERARFQQALTNVLQGELDSLADLHPGFEDPADARISSGADRGQALWLQAWSRWAHSHG